MIHEIIDSIKRASLEGVFFITDPREEPFALSDLSFNRDGRLIVMNIPTTFFAQEIAVKYHSKTTTSPGYVLITTSYGDYPESITLTCDKDSAPVIKASLRSGNIVVEYASIIALKIVFAARLRLESHINDTFVVDEDGTLLFYNGSENIKKIIVPEGVEAIGPHAFHGCDIRSVTLPESCEYIYEGAFESSSLEHIDLNRVSVIYPRAFFNTHLNSISLPKGVAVNDEAFAECESLVSINGIDGCSFFAESSIWGTSINTTTPLHYKIKGISKMSIFNMDVEEYIDECDLLPPDLEHIVSSKRSSVIVFSNAKGRIIKQALYFKGDDIYINAGGSAFIYDDIDPEISTFRVSVRYDGLYLIPIK